VPEDADAQKGNRSPGTGSPAATVLRRAGQQAVAAGRTFLDHQALERACLDEGIDHDGFFASLLALRDARLVDLHFVEPSRVTLLRLTDDGIRSHLAGAGPDVGDVCRRVVAALRDEAVSWRGGAPVDLAAAVGEPPLVVEVAMEDLRREGAVVFSRAFGGRLRVHRLS
jgi:hypothetical protein